MHVLLIHEIFVTPDEGGGTRHYEFAKFLVKNGHKVTVIASDVDYLSGKKKNRRSELRDGIEIHYAPTFSFVHSNFFARGIAFFSFSASSFLIAAKVKNVDIVWGTSPPLFQAFSSLLIAKLGRKKFIYEVRDLWLDFAKELGVLKNKFILNILRKIEKILYKRSDMVMINSPGFYPYLPSFLSKEKVILIPNGVDTKNFANSIAKGNDIKKRMGLMNKFVVLYAGNIGIANDMDNILKTAYHLNKFEDIVFVLIGDGIYKKNVERFIISNKIKNVMLLNPVSKKEIPKYISIADVCLATIKNTPLLQIVYPNKVFDYMASGKPTILTIGGAIRNVIENSKGGLYVTPGNPTELKKAILYYYNNKSAKLQHGENARNYVKQHFERSEIAKKLEISLLQLLDKGDRNERSK